MEVLSMIISVVIWGALFLALGYGIYKLIVNIKHKRKKKKEGID